MLATKITGKNAAFVRPGQDITAATFTEALDASLARLRTDVIDIYQMHWPIAAAIISGNTGASTRRKQDREGHPRQHARGAGAAEAAVKAGKIRHLALSNDSAWGTAQWLQLAEAHGLPRVQSIQNEYSLLAGYTTPTWPSWR